MTFLTIKLGRDLRQNWTQFFSVFLMAFLSVLIFVGLQGAWHGLEVSLDRYLDRSKLADAWVMTTGFTPDDMAEIEAIPGLKETGTSTRIQTKIAKQGDDEGYLYLETANSKLTVPHVTEGKQLDDKAQGIWLNLEYAKANKCSVGDTVELNFRGQAVKLKILGLVQSADRIYYTGTEEFIAPNYADYGYGYLSEETLKNSFSYQGYPNLLEFRGSPKGIRQKIEAIAGEKLVTYHNRETLADVSDALDRVGQIRNLSYLFSFIFVLLAILAMYTTIRRLIETQVKEIATLKALGFVNWQIGLHYTSFGFLVGASGVLLGAAISPVMSWFVLGTQKTMFSLPEWTIAYSYSALMMILFVLSICMLSSYLASRKATKGLPAEFLRGNTQKSGHKVFLESLPKFWQNLHFEQRWAIRDALSNKVRLLMGIIGVAGGMMLLIAGIGMPQSINRLVDKAYHENYHYDKRINVNRYDQQVKTTYPQGQWVQIKQARFSPDDGYNRLLIIMSSGDYVNLKTEDGKSITDGGVYVTKGFAKRAKLSVGQKLVMHPYLDNKAYTFEIKGIITSETNQGAYITQDTFESAGGTFSPSTLLLGKNGKVNEDHNVVSTINLSQQEANAQAFVASLMSIFLMIVGFAILLVVIVLYNLGALSFIERTRDYATLSVLGFSKKSLRQITMLENLGTTFIGWLLGIPLGIWFLDTYVRTFSTIRLEYTSHVTWLNLVLSTVIVVLCSMSTTLFVSRRLKKLDMIEALKGVD